MNALIKLILSTSVSFMLLISSVTAQENTLSLKEQSWVEYHDSGAYQNDISTAIAPALSYLKQRVQTDEKLAIVFDVDETVLSNFPNIRHLHFTTNKEAVAAAYLRGIDPAITPTKALYDFAIANNVAIFFVTGRPNVPDIYTATVNNLKKEGFTTFNSVYLRPLQDTHTSVVGYKSGIRQQITNLGYKIVLNIGDQLSDLEGGFAEKAIKLPNPFYTLS